MTTLWFQLWRRTAKGEKYYKCGDPVKVSQVPSNTSEGHPFLVDDLKEFLQTHKHFRGEDGLESSSIRNIYIARPDRRHLVTSQHARGEDGGEGTSKRDDGEAMAAEPEKWKAEPDDEVCDLCVDVGETGKRGQELRYGLCAKHPIIVVDETGVQGTLQQGILSSFPEAYLAILALWDSLTESLYIDDGLVDRVKVVIRNTCMVRQTISNDLKRAKEKCANLYTEGYDLSRSAEFPTSESGTENSNAFQMSKFQRGQVPGLFTVLKGDSQWLLRDFGASEDVATCVVDYRDLLVMLGRMYGKKKRLDEETIFTPLYLALVRQLEVYFHGIEDKWGDFQTHDIRKNPTIGLVCSPSRTYTGYSDLRFATDMGGEVLVELKSPFGLMCQKNLDQVKCQAIAEAEGYAQGRLRDDQLWSEDDDEGDAVTFVAKMVSTVIRVARGSVAGSELDVYKQYLEDGKVKAALKAVLGQHRLDSKCLDTCAGVAASSKVDGQPDARVVGELLEKRAKQSPQVVFLTDLFRSYVIVSYGWFFATVASPDRHDDGGISLCEHRYSRVLYNVLSSNVPDRESLGTCDPVPEEVPTSGSELQDAILALRMGSLSTGANNSGVLILPMGDTPQDHLAEHRRDVLKEQYIYAQKLKGLLPLTVENVQQIQ